MRNFTKWVKWEKKIQNCRWNSIWKSTNISKIFHHLTVSLFNIFGHIVVTITVTINKRYVLWPNSMNILYECLEFITAKSHLMSFLYVIKHWTKLIKFAWDLPWKLTDGRFEHPTGLSGNSVINRHRTWEHFHQEGKSEDRSLIRSKWEEWRSSVVTQKWDRRQCEDWKENFSLRGWRAKVWMNFVWYFYNLIFLLEKCTWLLIQN